MERAFVRAQAGAPLSRGARQRVVDDLAPVVVEREGRIVGLVPPRSGLWSRLRSDADVRVEDFMEPNLVLVRDTDLLSRALARLKRHRAGAALVYAGEGRPQAKDVVGVRDQARHRRRRDREFRGLIPPVGIGWRARAAQRKHAAFVKETPMSFRIQGLSPEPFAPLFGLAEADARRARRDPLSRRQDPRLSRPDRDARRRRRAKRCCCSTMSASPPPTPYHATPRDLRARGRDAALR